MSLRDANPSNPARPKRVALVIANPATSTTTGWPVGFWWSELTHPYAEFREAGYEVEVFSPAGGACEADAMSDPRDASGPRSGWSSTSTGAARARGSTVRRCTTRSASALMTTPTPSAHTPTTSAHASPSPPRPSRARSSSSACACA